MYVHKRQNHFFASPLVLKKIIIYKIDTQIYRFYIKRRKTMTKFLKFVYFLMSLISTFFVVRHGNSGMTFLSSFSNFCFTLYMHMLILVTSLLYITASPKYCMHGDDCNILCPNPLMGICTDYQCICM